MSRLLSNIKDKLSEKLEPSRGSTDSPDSFSPGSRQVLDPNAIQVPKVNGAYFVNWAIYARGYKPQNVPAQSLTHIFYAFADIKPDSGEVFLTDSWSDAEIHYDGDSWNDAGTNLYGNLKQLMLLKQKHRHLKTLISIGGWSFSSHFAPVASDAAKRSHFVRTAIEIMENYGFDGIDIDWEYPTNDAEAQDYVSLLRDVRNGLSEHQSQKGDTNPYLLTVAAPCGLDKIRILRLDQMSQHIDFFNLMGYDFAGSWSSVANHQANLYGSGQSVYEAVKIYIGSNVSAHQLVLGLPLYGRCFENTNGPGSPFSGIGQGSWEQGSYDYKVLPHSGASEQWDANTVSSWSYDALKRTMISYDTPSIARLKCEFVKQQGMRGTMFWELSGDVTSEGETSRSLVQTCFQSLGPIDQTENHLHYPLSKFDNVKNQMSL